MKTNNQQIINILKEQISLCDEMLEKLHARFLKNQISKEEFYPKMQKWDDKKYNYINELEILNK